VSNASTFSLILRHHYIVGELQPIICLTTLEIVTIEVNRFQCSHGYG